MRAAIHWVAARCVLGVAQFAEWAMLLTVLLLSLITGYPVSQRGFSRIEGISAAAVAVGSVYRNRGTDSPRDHVCRKDHGTAALVFVLGGGVQGGLAGARPSLDQLVDGEMVHTADYRTVYDGVLRDLWSIEAPQFSVAGATPPSLLTPRG